MGATKIEWADVTWNPATGCTPVSAGCAHCYAERMAPRFNGIIHPAPFETVVLHPDRLDAPLHWRKPRRVFVCSMGDLFHEDVPPCFVAHVFGIMAACEDHTFMVLTKRPHRINEVMSDRDFMSEFMVGYCDYGGCISREDAMNVSCSGCGSVTYPTDPTFPLPNVWLGVSVENQAAADERIPLLLQTPAAVRFVSAEPMLGPVDLGRAEGLPVYREADVVDDIVEVVGKTAEVKTRRPGRGWVRHDGNMHPWLDWAICGGETGPGARPMNPDWPRSLRDQCQAAGVPFFFKKMGGKIETPPDLMIRETPEAR